MDFYLRPRAAWEEERYAHEKEKKPETGNQLRSVFFSLNETARVPTTEVISFTKPDEDVITVLNSKVHFPRDDH